jgi:uroporphyrinogen decarboxylase
MDPEVLKSNFGSQVTFWGGGIDTQRTLPFGTAAEVRDQVKRNLEIFAPGGGYVFNPIHNVQSGVPVENLLAMYETFKENSSY